MTFYKTEQTDAAEVLAEAICPCAGDGDGQHVPELDQECAWSLSLARAVLASGWLAAREAAAEARGAERALRQAAKELRHQGSLRFDAHGPRDPRGAALWDAGCHIDPDDGNALAAQVAPPRVPGEGS